MSYAQFVEEHAELVTRYHEARTKLLLQNMGAGTCIAMMADLNAQFRADSDTLYSSVITKLLS